MDHLVGGQYVSSQSNPYHLLGRGSDVGGPFLSYKLENFGVPGPIWVRNGPYHTFARLYPNAAVQSRVRMGLSGSAAGSDGTLLAGHCPSALGYFTLDARGATAISRVKPTNPVFDGATAVAELISERKLFAVPGRNGGISGEYLNYQLGVAPAAGAYQDLREAMAKSEKTIDQLHRDSGKPIRRQYRFPTVTSESTEVSWGYPAADGGSLNAWQVESGRITTTTHTVTDIWFSGAFTYYLPKEVGFARKLAELDAIYGVKPGIDTVWELIPFSFVADYFSNVGEVLSNINAFAADGLVMRYGYVMAKQVTTQRVRWEGNICNYSWQPYSIDITTIGTTMQRRQANPFGFGVLDSDLSLRQMSILAALGLNRR